ncbi:hypothetical protein [Flavobacterium soli]|uniref:hypothetical protein n=1 Tax=Flavobacterium soli TaxID=344881 RepID=UPI00047B6966|nr:hypothetical protein [Flavobacterium soli]
MNDLDELIQFLRLNRRREENLEGDETNVVMATVLDTGQEIDIDKISFENLDTYKRLTNIFENFNATKIYYTQSDFDRKYYVKQPIYQNNGYNFVNVDTGLAEQISEDILSFIDIEYAFNQYVFDRTRKKVLLIAQELETVNVFSDAIVFKPENLDVSTGTYIYTFDDHKTLFGTISSAILNPLLSLIQLSDREVDLYKSDTTGSMYLIPRIGYSKGKYTITYLYTKSKKNFSRSIAQEDIALHLEFNFVGAFISFLNETILLEPNFNYLDDEASDRRLDFVDEFEKLIVLPLERNIISNSSGNYKDAITVLYYLGDDILFSLSQDTLWKVVDEAIKNDTLVNHSRAAEENIVLKLIKFIAERERNKDNFLIKLLEKTSHDQMSYLHFLYDRIDGDNSTNFVKIIHKTWMLSSFREIDPEKSKIITNDSPVILDYRSDKTLGFHTDNATIDWKTTNINVALTVGTGVYQTSQTKDGQGGTETKTEEVMETFQYSYHPFSPIAIINADNPTFIFKDPEQEGQPYMLLPAFVLYAREKSAFWQNWLTVAEYTVDILTTLSGFGNIIKVGRLYKILEAGKTIAGKTQIFTKIVTGVKGVAGVAEISSGSVNILLKLTNANDTELGREISKYLFYFEMIALSGELSLALYEKMQKSASKILAKKEVLKESAKNTDEAKQLDELVEELRKMADNRFKQLNSIADPVADILGAAYKSHPERLRKILAYVESKGGEVIYKLEEALGYSPGLSKGQPGQIHIHKEASISAWEHELKHFLDDEVAGFMGMRALGDTNFRVRSEFNAYKTEIDFVKKLKHKDEIEVIRQLKLNFKNELEYLTGRGKITDSDLVREIENFLK